MENTDIRQELLIANLKQWKVAERMGMSESTFSRMLRHELPQEKKNRIRLAISELSGEFGVM